MLDYVSILGDTVVFKETGINPEMKGVQVGSFIKEVSGKELSNNQYVEINLTGGPAKFTLLHFWGSWCAPCIENLPRLKEFSNKHDAVIKIIGFPYESTRDIAKTKSLVNKFGMNWQEIIQLRDAPFDKPDVVKNLRIDAFPTYILLNSKGEILARTSEISEIEKKLTDQK